MKEAFWGSINNNTWIIWNSNNKYISKINSR
jgi:hypothetical protein